MLHKGGARNGLDWLAADEEYMHYRGIALATKYLYALRESI